MGVQVRKVGDKGGAVRTLADKAKGKVLPPFATTALAIQCWNPPGDDSAIWLDATSFYAYGVFSPDTAVLTAWVVDDQTGNELFRTGAFLIPPYPPEVPAGANWACLCTGLTRGQPGMFFIQARDGTHTQICNAHFTTVR